MNREIEALRLNNAAPSDEAAQEIKKLLLTNLQDLDNINSEILDLENRLHDLRTKRDTTQRTIHQYRSILSPLRRIAPEVLGEIFYRCLPTHRNPTIKATECPILLTHVCSLWRAAAISEPRLWERIYITFTDDVHIESDWPPRSMGHTTRMLRRRLHVIRKWISRSGSRPLSISICFTTIGFGSTFNDQFYFCSDDDDNVVKKFLEYLASLSPRFKDLELNMPICAYHIFEDMIDVPGMTKLTSLRADLLSRDFEELETIDAIALLSAPNLNSISVSTNNCIVVGAWQDPPPWSARLTDFSFHRTSKPATFYNRLAAADVLFILHHLPNLIHFKSVISKEDFPEDSEATKNKRISLPFLRTFSIKDEVDPYATDNLRLYARIDAPGITWVEYGGPLKSPKDNRAYCSILALLERLPALKKLTINCEHFKHGPPDRPHSVEWDFLRSVLRAVPSVTHLFIGCEERSPSGSLTRYPPCHTSQSWSGQALYDLPLHNLIGVQAPKKKNPVPYDNSNPPPLPNLTSLEISSCIMEITNEDLIRAVVSRINPALFPSSSTSSHVPVSGSVIARLKHVGVVFYRQQTLDIATKVREYAERVGADMVDMSLDYPEPSPAPKMAVTRTPALAPDYGLSALNGRSWDYKDAEEFEDHL